MSSSLVIRKKKMSRSQGGYGYTFRCYSGEVRSSCSLRRQQGVHKDQGYRCKNGSDLIRDLIHQGAKIDSFGVGERLITSKSAPVFGGVYKLCAVENADGSITPKIKVSENPGKITNPGFKKIYPELPFRRTRR